MCLNFIAWNVAFLALKNVSICYKVGPVKLERQNISASSSNNKNCMHHDCLYLYLVFSPAHPDVYHFSRLLWILLQLLLTQHIHSPCWRHSSTGIRCTFIASAQPFIPHDHKIMENKGIPTCTFVVAQHKHSNTQAPTTIVNELNGASHLDRHRSYGVRCIIN